MSYLLDKNVICELVAAKPNKMVLKWFDKIPPETLHVSVLTLGEIRKGIESIKEEKRKETLRVWLEIDLPTWFGKRILAVDYHVADVWGRLQNNEKRTLPAIDSLIAATALHYDLRLVTRNIKDFKFSFLQAVNPWDGD